MIRPGEVCTHSAFAPTRARLGRHAIGLAHTLLDACPLPRAPMLRHHHRVLGANWGCVGPHSVSSHREVSPQRIHNHDACEKWRAQRRHASCRPLAFCPASVGAKADDARVAACVGAGVDINFIANRGASGRSFDGRGGESGRARARLSGACALARRASRRALTVVGCACPRRLARGRRAASTATRALGRADRWSVVVSQSTL